MDSETSLPLRARLMREAGDVIGSERLAAALNMSPRNLYQIMAGKRPVKDGVLRDTRGILIRHRQAIMNLVRDFSQEEALDAA